MSIKAIMTPLADAVRSKTGLTSTLGVESMTTALNNIPTKSSNTITPSTQDQTVVSSGEFVTGDIVIKGDENLIPENIVEGVSIFGVNGTYSSSDEYVPAVPVDISLDHMYASKATVFCTKVHAGTTQTEYITKGQTLSLECIPGSIIVVYVGINGDVMCGLSGGYSCLLYHEESTLLLPVDMFVFQVSNEACHISICDGPEMSGGEL